MVKYKNLDDSAFELQQKIQLSEDDAKIDALNSQLYRIESQKFDLLEKYISQN